MKTRKILAGLMALTVVAAMAPMAAFADEGTGTGTGKLEGSVNTDVVSVVLPTTLTTNADALNFTMDPEGLINKTSAAAYSGATFNTGTLFFKNANNNYSNASDIFTITNKSSTKVDVAVTANVTDADGITLTSNSAFTDDTSASLYLALQNMTSGSAADVTAITENGATLTATIDEAPDGAYKYNYNDTSKAYEYVLDGSFSGTFAKYEFNLTGAANSAGDWSDLTAVAPKVELVWNVAKHVDSYLSTKTVSASANEITVTTPETVTVKSVVLNKTNGSNVTLATGTHYNVSENKYTFLSSVLVNTGCSITFNFSDGKTEVITIA